MNFLKLFLIALSANLVIIALQLPQPWGAILCFITGMTWGHAAAMGFIIGWKRWY